MDEHGGFAEIDEQDILDNVSEFGDSEEESCTNEINTSDDEDNEQNGDTLEAPPNDELSEQNSVNVEALQQDISSDDELMRPSLRGSPPPASVSDLGSGHGSNPTPTGRGRGGVTPTATPTAGRVRGATPAVPLSHPTCLRSCSRPGLSQHSKPASILCQLWSMSGICSKARLTLCRGYCPQLRFAMHTRGC